MAFELEKFLKDFYELPTPENYFQWIRVNDEVTVHTLGRVPEKLRTRRPGEPDDVFDYRIAILEPITKGSINKGFDNLYRIFQNTSWSWVASKVLNEFLLTARFKDQCGFKEYTEKEVLRVGIEDPNGVLCWWPVYDEAEGYTGITPRLYNSRKIRWKTDDAILILDEQVEVSAKELLAEKFNPTLKYNRGDKYILLSREGIWTIEIPKGQQNKLIVTPIIEMDFDAPPFVIIGGNKNSAGYYESFFSGFIPFGNEALMNFSDHQAVNVQFSYPVREEKAQKCTNPKCRQGTVLPNTGTLIEGRWTCDTCKGSGYVKSRSPWGVYITQKDTLFQDENEPARNIPAVQFHSPDPAILAYSSEEWRKFKQDAEQGLHLVYINQSQSGDAKKEDQRGLYALLQNIGDNYYDNIIFNSMWILEQMLNGSPVKPVIYKPAKYTITDKEDPVADIANMIQSGAPKHLITLAIEEFLRYQYNEANPVHKITATLILFDPYFSYTPTEKERMLALGVIDIDGYRRRDIAYMLLRKLSLQMGDDFLHIEIDALIRKLETEIKPFLEPKQKVLTEPDGSVVP